jgi:hypothetical protein
VTNDVLVKEFAIDPGPEESAWIHYKPHINYSGVPENPIGAIGDFGISKNTELLERVGTLKESGVSHVSIEMIASYGMPVGKSTFETCVWIGKYELLAEQQGIDVSRIYRKECCVAVCGSSRAKDSNIRQALIDLFGGEEKGIGGKKCPECKGKGEKGKDKAPCVECDASGWKYPPGELYKISADVWAALAVAVTHRIKLKESGLS